MMILSGQQWEVFWERCMTRSGKPRGKTFPIKTRAVLWWGQPWSWVVLPAASVPYVSAYSYCPPCSAPCQELRNRRFSPCDSLTRRISCVSLQLTHGFPVSLEWWMGGSLSLREQQGMTRTFPSPLPQHCLTPLKLVIHESCLSLYAGYSHWLTPV